MEAFRACLCSPTDGLYALLLCCGLAFVVIAAAAPAAAQSEPQVGGTSLSAYVATADYLDRLNAYIVGYETWIGPCPDPEPVQRVDVLLAQRTVPLPGDPDPGAPQWIERLRITGCAADYERTVYVSMRGAKPVFHARLLGSSRTTPRLEGEAVTAVIAAEHAAAVAAGCPETRPVRVLGAAYEDRFDTEYGTGWHETWMIADCRGARHIAMTFTPDHTGGTRFDFTAPVE